MDSRTGKLRVKMFSGDTPLRKESDHGLRAWNGKVKIPPGAWCYKVAWAETEQCCYKKGRIMPLHQCLLPAVAVLAALLFSWLFCWLFFLAIIGSGKEELNARYGTLAGGGWDRGWREAPAFCSAELLTLVLAQARNHWKGRQQLRVPLSYIWLQKST